MDADPTAIRQEQEITVQSLFDQLGQWGGAMARAVVRDKDDKPIRAVIAVDGYDETLDVIEALDAVEEEWHRAE